MSTVIAMAYAQYVPVMHLTSSALHLEEIRRVTSRLSELVTESERARLDLQMLFGVHVYSRAKVVPDLALSRGEDAHRAAKLVSAAPIVQTLVQRRPSRETGTGHGPAAPRLRAAIRTSQSRRAGLGSATALRALRPRRARAMTTARPRGTSKAGEICIP